MAASHSLHFSRFSGQGAWTSTTNVGACQPLAEVVLRLVRSIEDSAGGAAEEFLDRGPVDPGPVGLRGVRVVRITSERRWI